ncbi:flagellar basal body P-ring protein FlgI, partial [Serratia ureilytica]|uniref:flagellar basal body P-ring protein FlgI n=1 Tax=Serratia ureilytica TaxID=300181 RepID=UPI0034C6DBC5
GATIGRELPTAFGSGGVRTLQLDAEDFTLAQQISDAINRHRGGGTATPLDARTIQVLVPQGNSSQLRFLAEIQNITANAGAMDAKVIINSRTGLAVMNRDVILVSCAVAPGNLSVAADRQNTVSQPTTPFGGG